MKQQEHPQLVAVLGMPDAAGDDDVDDVVAVIDAGGRRKD